MTQTLPDSLCYLNGSYGPLAEAKVSVLDRGFIFGDGVYEVLPVYGRRLFRFDEHMARLSRSLAKLRIANPHSSAEWLEKCRTLIAAQTSDDQLVYIQVTRGVALRDHVMPPDIDADRLHDDQRDEAAHGRAAPPRRGLPDRARLPLGARRHQEHLAARQRAGAADSADHGAVETILFRNGFLTEASASNVWVVHEGALLGPPKGEHVLEGIRYELLRELCEEEGIAYNLRPIAEADVLAADEILLSSATKEVLPVTLLDNEPVGHGALAWQARTGLCPAARGLPARQGSAVDLSPCSNESRRGRRTAELADRVPEQPFRSR